ncbi:MAG: small subunit ribosomal protein S16 [Lentimonas sp.]|jgi:small subunit ribosomal protein S16
MSIKIRLSRGGRKSLPFYSIVATNSTSPRDGKFLEKLGTYNPVLAKDNENRLVVKSDRAEYWISVGATPSTRVAGLLIELGIKGAEKYAAKFVPKEKYTGAKKKTLERLASNKEAAEAAAAKAIEDAEAAKVAAAEAKVAAAEAKAAEAEKAEADKAAAKIAAEEEAKAAAVEAPKEEVTEEVKTEAKEETPAAVEKTEEVKN